MLARGAGEAQDLPLQGRGAVRTETRNLRRGISSDEAEEVDLTTTLGAEPTHQFDHAPRTRQLVEPFLEELPAEGALLQVHAHDDDAIGESAVLELHRGAVHIFQRLGLGEERRAELQVGADLHTVTVHELALLAPVLGQVLVDAPLAHQRVSTLDTEAHLNLHGRPENRPKLGHVLLGNELQSTLRRHLHDLILRDSSGNARQDVAPHRGRDLALVEEAPDAVDVEQDVLALVALYGLDVVAHFTRRLHHGVFAWLVETAGVVTHRATTSPGMPASTRVEEGERGEAARQSGDRQVETTPVTRAHPTTTLLAQSAHDGVPVLLSQRDDRLTSQFHLFLRLFM